MTSGSLVAAAKVKGTSVYNLQGEKLGTVENLIIDKVSGRVVYAVMSFGGFVGIGGKYHPLPWSVLKYDDSKGGYVSISTRRCSRMRRATTWTSTSAGRRNTAARVDKYYSAPTYW